MFETDNYIIKLAETEKEHKDLFRLRYFDLLKYYNQDYYNETQEDKDEYDEYCDHLIIIDKQKKEVIGTYRLIKSEHLTVLKNFLTEKEFNIDPLKKYNILEVGRAVVKEEYRSGIIIMLLWKAVITYAVENNIDFMIGTASFQGVDPNLYADAFTYLEDKFLSPIDIRCEVNKESCFSLKQKDCYNLLEAKKQLPPLVKGYLNLGASIGNGVFVDIPFNSLDVLIVLKIKEINEKYLKRLLYN